MPKRISRPPAATTPAGQVSAASDVAEAPRISTRSPSAAATAAATAAASCATVTGGAIVCPSAASRARTASAPEASRLGFIPGVLVWISVARPRRNGCSRIAPGPAVASRRTARSRSGPGTA